MTVENKMEDESVLQSVRNHFEGIETVYILLEIICIYYRKRWF